MQDLVVRTEFFKELENKVLDKISYRPHVFHANQIESTGILKSEGFNLKSVVDKDVLKIIRGAKLLISNHYGTTLHQALAWNIPIVCYWNANVR